MFLPFLTCHSFIIKLIQVHIIFVVINTEAFVFQVKCVMLVFGMRAKKKSLNKFRAVNHLAGYFFSKYGIFIRLNRLFYRYTTENESQKLCKRQCKMSEWWRGRKVRWSHRYTINIRILCSVWAQIAKCKVDYIYIRKTLFVHSSYATRLTVFYVQKTLSCFFFGQCVCVCVFFNIISVRYIFPSSSYSFCFISFGKLEMVC